MSFEITEAQLYGLAFECILYGVLLLTSWKCLSSLLFQPGHNGRLERRDARGINWGLLVAAILLFGLGTVDMAMGLRHCLNAFVYYNGPGGPTEHFRDISDPISITKARYRLSTVS
jgi:hypothetical protein